MLNQEVIAQGEEFKEMAKDALPLIIQLEEVLKKHGVSNMASLTTDVSTGSDWEMLRTNNEYPVKIEYSFSEALDLEEKKEA